MRFSTITTRLCELSEALGALPKPADERRALGREAMEVVAAGLFILESHDESTPAKFAVIVAQSRQDLARYAPLLGGDDPAVRIVREMIALASGEILPPPPDFSRVDEPINEFGDEDDPTNEYDDPEDEEEPGDQPEPTAPAGRPAFVCQFPGDFRPLLHADLSRIEGATWEQRRTTDWLLLQCAEKLLAHVRKLPADRAWGVYAALAEKLNLDAEEAAERAARSPVLRAPSATELARAYVGRDPSDHCFVPGATIADEILPHLGLGRLDASGALLHTVQEFAALDLHAVAEYILAGPGTMREYRRARGGRLCRRCGDYSYPGERHCRRCGPDPRRFLLPLIVAAVIAFLLAPPLLWLLCR